MIVITDDVNYKNIANAIREKNGLDVQYTPSEMPDAISALEIGGGIQDLTALLIDDSFVKYTAEPINIIGKNVVTLKESVLDRVPINYIDLPNCTKLSNYSLRGYNNAGFPSVEYFNIPLLSYAAQYALSYRVFEQDVIEFNTDFQANNNSFFSSSGKKICFSGKLSIFSGSFSYSKFEVIDIALLVISQGQNSLKVDPSVTRAIIIRNTEVPTLSVTTIFPTIEDIGDNDFYIYVPSDLVDTYKTETNWTIWADRYRAIEDYPDICG